VDGKRFDLRSQLPARALTFVGAGVELEVHVHGPHLTSEPQEVMVAADFEGENGPATPPPSPARTSPSSSRSSSPRPSVGSSLGGSAAAKAGQLLIRRPFYRARSMDGSSHTVAIYVKRNEAVEYLDAGRVF